MGKVPSTLTACMRAVVATSVVFGLTLPSTADAEKLEDMAQRVGVHVLAEGTSDKDMLNYTKSRIPWARMSPRSRQRASEILNDLSQYRRMPSLQYRVDTGIYQYLISHPDVAVSTWRVMGISKLNMRQTGKFEYEASAADGSEGIADVLWRDNNQCLFIVQGKYTSPLLPGAVHASALVWLQYRFVKGKDGSDLVNQQVETFIHFPSGAVDAVARMASRVTNSILDRNAFEVSLYAKMMSQAAEKEPEWIDQLASRMEGVPPHRRDELIQAARRRQTASTSQAMPLPHTRRPDRVALSDSGEFRRFADSLHREKEGVPVVAVSQPTGPMPAPTGNGRIVANQRGMSPASDEVVRGNDSEIAADSSTDTEYEADSSVNGNSAASSPSKAPPASAPIRK